MTQLRTLQGGRRGHAVDVEASIDAMPNVDRYRKAYEDSINPFTVFNQKQKALRRDNMIIADRVLLEVRALGREGCVVDGSMQQCIVRLSLDVRHRRSQCTGLATMFLVHLISIDAPSDKISVHLISIDAPSALAWAYSLIARYLLVRPLNSSSGTPLPASSSSYTCRSCTF